MMDNIGKYGIVTLKRTAYRNRVKWGIDGENYSSCGGVK